MTSQYCFDHCPGRSLRTDADSGLTTQDQPATAPHDPAVGFADELLKLAGNAYLDVIHRRPRYLAFLERHPKFGLDELGTPQKV
ncbi:hypothetical protein [Actinokineospora xionganensis]|uniref:Uncharacterized protein n=1 Tax=Actinokineospora xionganensis TaxID=2684470 RepID=A0ABR7L5D8_9PSEU|nr:hypothetical protein [Actinokineospora xionganensis]MBC6447562.1 hypothetical protein [Actinokineospora xionganensis]